MSNTPRSQNMPSTNAEKCWKKHNFYQRLFPDCASIASTELAAMMSRSSEGDVSYTTNEGSPVHLVDVRSDPERDVSVIPGSISLAEFEEMVAPNISDDALVVCYCTIGFRSGLEARRLNERYKLTGRVRNLDGIIAYTHAQQSDSSLHLVNGTTGEFSDRVHIFGSRWDCADKSYTATPFSLSNQAKKGAQIGLRATVLMGQHALYRTKNVPRLGF